MLVTDATSGLRRRRRTFKLNSGEIDKEATFGGSPIDGQPAGDRESRLRIDLPASRRERYRLESDSSRHHARELHQQHRVQLLYRGHNVSTALVSPLPSHTHVHSFLFGLKVDCNNITSALMVLTPCFVLAACFCTSMKFHFRALCSFSKDVRRVWNSMFGDG